MIQRIALRRTLAHGAVSIAEVIRPDTDFEVELYGGLISVSFFFNIATSHSIFSILIYHILNDL